MQKKEEIQKIKTLLKHEDFTFVKQGWELLENLAPTYALFMQYCIELENSFKNIAPKYLFKGAISKSFHDYPHLDFLRISIL